MYEHLFNNDTEYSYWTYSIVSLFTHLDYLLPKNIN